MANCDALQILSRELARLMDVEVRCFGEQHVDDGRLHVRGFPAPNGMTAPDYLRPVFGAMARDVAWAGTDVQADAANKRITDALGAQDA